MLIGLNDLFVMLARPTICQQAALPFAQITASNNSRCGKSAPMKQLRYKAVEHKTFFSP